MIFTNLPNLWVNGAPYSCYTSTLAKAEQTCIHISSKQLRIVLVLEKNYISNVLYNWKIPMIKNSDV
jgi:hypothetical protein